MCTPARRLASEAIHAHKNKWAGGKQPAYWLHSPKSSQAWRGHSTLLTGTCPVSHLHINLFAGTFREQVFLLVCDG